MQDWESLLHATGGKLEINKCQLIKFSWEPDEDGSYNIRESISTKPIQIQDQETKGTICISETSTSTAYKLLGVSIAFDGNTREQEAAVINLKCEQMATAFTKCHLAPDKALQGYRSKFLSDIKYGLTATNFPHRNLTLSQKVMTRALLPKMGFNGNTPSPITYGPLQFGGIGIQDLHSE
jgi:hypothetical protein